MQLQAGNLGYLLWFGLASAIGVQVAVRSREATPAIESRARSLNVLERAMVAVRQAARHEGMGSVAVRASLLAHGILAEEEATRGPRERLRLRLRVDAGRAGELCLIEAPDGQVVARACSGAAGDGLEVRALVRPPGER